MKKILIGLFVLFLMGCSDDSYEETSTCICDDCIRINLEKYIGNELFQDDISMGTIGNIDYGVVYNSEIKVCMARNNETGYCEQELFRFQLDGKC